MTPFVTNARFAETGDAVGLDAGLAAAGEADGEGAARSEPLDASTAVNIARVIVSPTPRRTHRHRVLKKDLQTSRADTDSARRRHKEKPYHYGRYGSIIGSVRRSNS